MYHGKIVQKRKVHTLKGKLTLTDYNRLLIDYKKTTKLTDQLQKTIKVGHRLQTLLIDYKKLQRLDLHYKIRVRVKRSSKVSLTHPSHSRHIFDGEIAGVCTETLQGPYSIFSFRNFIQGRAAEA